MTIQEETSLRIDFSRGVVTTPIVVFEGAEVETETFNKETHHIEELLDFITYNENGGCDVFI
jgi:hypothetical protein